MSALPDARRLLDEAAAAMGNAHAPYSSFRVGAALLTETGAIFRGANVENASYGLSLCAERAAVAGAVAAGHRRFRALAVVAGSPHRASPCGACRQVLAEFCDGGFPVHIASASALDAFDTRTLDELLPHRFSLPTTRSRRSHDETHQDLCSRHQRPPA